MNCERTAAQDSAEAGNLVPQPYLEDRKTRIRAITPAVKRRFLALLEAGHNAVEAARQLGHSFQAFYYQRQRDAGFAEAWAEARERGKQLLAELYEESLHHAAIKQHNVGALAFGLKNFRPTEWRDRHEIDQRSLHASVTLGVKDLPPGALAALLPLVQRELEQQQQRALPEPDGDDTE